MKKTVCSFLSIAVLLSLTSCNSRKEESKTPIDDSPSSNNTLKQNLPSYNFFNPNDTIEPVLPDYDYSNEGENTQEKSEDTDIKKVDTPPTSAHENTIPQSEKEKNSDDETSIDVSEESLEALSANYFNLPEDILSGQKLYQKLKEMYLSSEWNGLAFEIDEHVFSISSKGYILADNMLIGNNAEPLDLPNQSRYDNGVGLIDDCNIQYVPGKGSYILIDESYMLYLRGEKIQLEGEPLNWKEGEGVDVNYGHAILHYAEGCDKMFLTTPIAEDSSVNYMYLYIFPDYNVSKIEFVAKINGTFLYNNEENTVYYQDTDDVWWMYCEKEDGSYYFEKIS